MRVLIAPDKFKGSLDAAGVARAVDEALDGWETSVMPVADGGEGTAELIGRSLGGRRVALEVTGPLGEPVQAGFWLATRGGGDAGLAVMEMSSASGLDLVPPGRRDPWRATTFGTGELLLAARAAMVDEIWIGIGGSATIDGGAGMAAALGHRFIGRAGEEIDDIPAGVQRAASLFPDLAVDLPGVTALCDVSNPLLGVHGATRVFGPQKGVGEADLPRFEERMEHFAELVGSEFGSDFRNHPGAGAAGGLGFGLMSFCDAALRPGFEVVAGAIGLPAAVEGADLVITGEGRIDAGTDGGKAPLGVARLARAAGKPVVAVCGSVDPASAAAAEFDAVLPLVAAGEDPSRAMAEPAAAVKNAVARALPMLKELAP